MTVLKVVFTLLVAVLALWVAFEILVNVVSPPPRPSRLPSEPSGADAKLLVKDNAIAVLNAGTLRRKTIHSSTPKERDA